MSAFLHSLIQGATGLVKGLMMTTEIVKRLWILTNGKYGLSV
jgi:hypothetical protein